MNLKTFHTQQGAALAPDGIPLHYGDQLAEYHAALEAAVVLDRSHEGRIHLYGKDRYELLNRMTTNQMQGFRPGEGRPTIFTNATGRVLDRILVYDRSDYLLVVTGPGRGDIVSNFLQRNIFFNDDVQLKQVTAETCQFAVHGPQADAVAGAVDPDLPSLPPLHGATAQLAGAEVFAARNKPLAGAHWIFIVPAQHAVAALQALQQAGAPLGLRSAGSLTYNVLRIRSGQPAQNELNTDYIPLEIGLWDEISFNKGCYTGQEIIARMESRSQLAKTIVSLELGQFVQAPADIEHDGKRIGRLTSSVLAPDGSIFALGVVKTAMAAPGHPVHVGPDAVAGTVIERTGTPPPYLQTPSSSDSAQAGT